MKKHNPTFTKGGVHPPQSKLTAGQPVVPVALPRKVMLLLSQHIGAPATPVVAKGDEVTRGQLVADASGFVSASIHTPISGVVTDIRDVFSSTGMPVKAIVIEAEEHHHIADENARKTPRMLRDTAQLDALTPAEIRDIAGGCGLVGLGGATFPAKVKLAPPADAKIDYLIINGAECEPYLTCDDALMRSKPDEIIAGVRLMARACGAASAIVGIEDNKPEAIGAMTGAASTFSDVKVVALQTKYPQGGEKQLVQALTGRSIPSGALPAAVGVVVHNVATAHALFRAAAHGLPVMERIVTVTGDVARPGNYLVAVGSRIGSIIDTAGGLRGDNCKIVLGGPMMGRAANNVDAPTVKGVSGILVMPEDRARRPQAMPCIRCGGCLRVCPMGLEPYLISTYGRLGLLDEGAAAGTMDCIECGCCSYTCPSDRPLVDYIRLGKKNIADKKRRDAAAVKK